ncbi:major facilitator superfamily domain-containing protein [Mycena polygramma]|nr:major facilitator superfamily domain-containing protein [Mycena polygramma]
MTIPVHFKANQSQSEKSKVVYGVSSFSGETAASPLEGAVCRKLDLHILPVLTTMLLLAFLDRNNIGNARVAGLQRDLEMSNYQYSIILTVTYIPYILVQIPSNLALKRIGANVLLPTMITFWGFTSMMQGFVQTYSGLIACRFFLGLFEGGLLPGITLYFTSFYPRATLQFRISVVFATSSLAGAFSGLLASAIIKMEGVGGRHGWSWVFILEGLFTILFGLSAFFLLPKTLKHTKFLNSCEKDYLKERLTAEGMTEDDPADGLNWPDIIYAFKSPHIMLMAIMGFFGGSTQGGLAYFEPSIVQTLGYSPARTQLMSVPPFAVSFVLSLVSAAISDRYRCRGFTSILFYLFGAIGFAMWLGSNSHAVKYGSLFLSVPGANCAAPALGAWNANNAAPYTRRATALAVLTIGTNAGGILATWLLGSLSSPPNYTKAALTLTIFSAGGAIAALIIMWYLISQNRDKAKEREMGTRDGEAPGLGNGSAWFIYSL